MLSEDESSNVTITAVFPAGGTSVPIMLTIVAMNDTAGIVYTHMGGLGTGSWLRL